MSADKRRRLICYDIRESARWRDVYKIVRGRGHRVQYSICRARPDDLQVERLRWELARVMAPEDALLIVDLCPTCATNVISRNHVDGWQEQISRFGSSVVPRPRRCMDLPMLPRTRHRIAKITKKTAAIRSIDN
jgi:CRISPR-associated protein Cas2